jgi:hypothetical protein
MAGENKDDLSAPLTLAKSAKHRLWVFAYTLSDAASLRSSPRRQPSPALIYGSESACIPVPRTPA